MADLHTVQKVLLPEQGHPRVAGCLPTVNSPGPSARAAQRAAAPGAGPSSRSRRPPASRSRSLSRLRGAANASIGNLIGLASALGQPLASLFENIGGELPRQCCAAPTTARQCGCAARPATPWRRPRRRSPQRAAGCVRASLSVECARKAIELVSHEGEEFLEVTQGRLEFHLAASGWRWRGRHAALRRRDPAHGPRPGQCAGAPADGAHAERRRERAASFPRATRREAGRQTCPRGGEHERHTHQAPIARRCR